MGKQDMPKGGPEKPKKKEKGPLSPEEYAQKMEMAKNEAETRGERVEKLKARVNKLFPNPEHAKLREEIETSFDVPQVGDFHNEGMLMDTHLDGILTSIQDIAEGKYQWPADMPESTRRILEDTVKKNREALERYTFLHDLAKKDTLRLSFSEQTADGPKGEDIAYTLAEWQAMVPEEVRRDPAKLLEFMQGEGQARKIIGISYFHKAGDKTPSGGKVAEGRMHGESGSEAIRNLGETGVDELTLTTITHHEVAYQFTAPNVDTYEKFFGSLSEQERNLVMVASFVDSMSSLRPDGTADASNFLALAVSRSNAEAIKGLTEKLAVDDKLEKRKVEKALLALKKAGKPIDFAAELARLAKECRPTEYDPAKLDEMLAELTNKGALTADETAEVRALILANNEAELGKKFGKKMGQLRAVMTASEKKD